MPPKTVSGVDTKRSIIPSSRRPDGTLRKQIQVKPGFIPVEDQVAFVSSRMKQNDIVIGGGERKAKQDESGLSAAALKNLRRKERKLAQKANAGDDLHSNVNSSEGDKDKASTEAGNSLPKQLQQKLDITDSEQIPIEKQIRNLQKKLRKIDELVAKRDNGADLDKDQIEKISKRAEIEKELRKLEGSLS